jgi:hypothetical protein
LRLRVDEAQSVLRQVTAVYEDFLDYRLKVGLARGRLRRVVTGGTEEPQVMRACMLLGGENVWGSSVSYGSGPVDA